MSETPTAAPVAASTQDDTTTQAPVVRAPLQINYDPQNPASLYMDGGAFGQIQRVGAMLAESALVPDHLRGKKADCALIVAQAFRWQLDPLAVAAHTYVVHGKLGYEGKLIAALVNVSGRLAGPLRYAYSGDGAKRSIVVSGRIKGESEDRVVSGDFAGWHTKDKSGTKPSDQWTRQPDSMLRYRGAREWARAHVPEVILGIQAEDDLEAREVEVGSGRSDAAAAGNGRLAEALRACDGEHPGPRCSAPDCYLLVGESVEEAPEDPAVVKAREIAEAKADREVGADDDDPAPTAAAPQPARAATPKAASPREAFGQRR